MWRLTRVAPRPSPLPIRTADPAGVNQMNRNGDIDNFLPSWHQSGVSRRGRWNFPSAFPSAPGSSYFSDLTVEEEKMRRGVAVGPPCSCLLFCRAGGLHSSTEEAVITPE